MSELLYGREPTTPGFVTIAASGQLLPAVPGKRYRIFAMFANPLAATTLKLQSNVTDIGPTWNLGATGGFVLPHCKKAWIVGVVGDPINAVLGVATNVAFNFLYDLVD